MKYRAAVENAFTEDQKNAVQGKSGCNLGSCSEKSDFYAGQRKKKRDHHTFRMYENRSGKPSVKENSVCGNSKNFWNPGKAESRGSFYGILERWKICSSTSRGRKKLSCSFQIWRRDHMEIFRNWSMAKLQEGKYVSLRLGGLNWEDHVLHAELEPGEYRIVTSNRLPNGNIFAYVYHFSIEAGQQKEITLCLWSAIWKICWKILNFQNLS